MIRFKLVFSWKNSKTGLISRTSYFGAIFRKCRCLKDSIERVEYSEDSINCKHFFFANSRRDFSMMCSALICVNMRLPDEWLPLSEGGANRSSLVQWVDRIQLIVWWWWWHFFRSMQLFINDQMEMVIPSLERTQMTDTEMYAILALMLCDSGTRILV